MYGPMLEYPSDNKNFKDAVLALRRANRSSSIQNGSRLQVCGSIALAAADSMMIAAAWLPAIETATPSAVQNQTKSSILLTQSQENYRNSTASYHSQILPESLLNLKCAKPFPKTRWNWLAEKLQSGYEFSRVKHLFPLLLLIGYSFLGGAIFCYIEAPSETGHISEKSDLILKEKNALLSTIRKVHHMNVTKDRALSIFREATQWYALTVSFLSESAFKGKIDRSARVQRLKTLRKYTNELAERCWEISLEVNFNIEKTERLLSKALSLFAHFTHLSNEINPVWTFWNSMFLAMTTYTTIGYGNIVPETRNGKIAAMIYAVLGIPMFLMFLHKLGHIFLALIQKFWNGFAIFLEQLNCVRHSAKLKNRTLITVETGKGRETYNVPVSLAVGIAFAWIFVCAAIFLHFEPEWSYFKSFYFIFISLTTIGYGDVTPTSSKAIFFTFGLIVIGLSLVNMCINLVQIKLESLFEDLMLMMMEEYQSAQIGEGSMDGTLPQIDGKPGMMQLWKMWQKRRRKSQPSGSFSATGNASSKLLMSLMTRKHQSELLDEWAKKASMRVKGVQTEPTFLRAAYVQTDQFACCAGAKKQRKTRTQSTQSQPARCQNALNYANMASQKSLLQRTDNVSQNTVNYSPQYGKQMRMQTADMKTEFPLQKVVVGGNRKNSGVSNWSSCSQQAVSSQPSDLLEFEVDVHNIDEVSDSVPLFFASPHYTKHSHVFRPQVESPAASSASWPIRIQGRICSPTESSKSWTFVTSAGPSRTGPRGIIPLREAKKQSKVVLKDDLKALMQEIDLRLDDCRHIARRDARSGKSANANIV